MSNYFAISDTHFYDKAVHRYGNRPDNFNGLIMNNWNETVEPQDIVIHLGDFGFGTKEELKELADYLNGDIWIIKGNHDPSPKVLREVFDRVYDTPIFFDHNGVRYLLSHYPVRSLDRSVVNLHGHTHGTSVATGYRRHIDVSVELTNYAPVPFPEVEGRALELLDICKEHGWR